MLTVGHSRGIAVPRRLGLTELICEVIMALEDFNQVVKHGKIDGYFRGDFFHKIRLFFNTKLYTCGISIGKRPRASQVKLSKHPRKMD